ncbi:hypothetical protein PMAYCL1PPCAC_01508, partial [Pristionchus mayeri]
MHFFTANPKKREMWVDGVRQTPEGRRFLMKLLSTRKAPHLCHSHFSPSDYKQTSRRMNLRSDAVPFFEIFCPSTGNSRPLDNATPTINNNNPSKILRRKCVVCHRMEILAKTHQFTTDQERRITWINAVRSTPEGRNSLEALLSRTKRCYVCASHFSSSGYSLVANRSQLRYHAVPFFDDSESKSSEVEEFPLFETVTPNEFKEESMECKDEPIDDFEQNLKQKEPFDD